MVLCQVPTKICKISARVTSNWVEPSRVGRDDRASITVERRARNRAARVGPGAAHALLLAGFLGARTSAVAVGSARTTGFLNAANDDAYTPLLSVSFPPQRVRLARSCSLRVSFRFFFTVLYNRQSPVLRGPGPESPALLYLPFFLPPLLSFSLASSREHSRALFRLRQRAR